MDIRIDLPKMSERRDFKSGRLRFLHEENVVKENKELLKQKFESEIGKLEDYKISFTVQEDFLTSKRVLILNYEEIK